MAAHVIFNGMHVEAPGYWADVHGHRVFVCSKDTMPSCPVYPFATTRWMLQTAVSCHHVDPKSEIAG